MIIACLINCLSCTSYLYDGNAMWLIKIPVVLVQIWFFSLRKSHGFYVLLRVQPLHNFQCIWCEGWFGMIATGGGSQELNVMGHADQLASSPSSKCGVCLCFDPL